MDVNSKSYQELLKKRPLNVQARFGSEAIGLVSGRDIVAAAKEVDSIVLLRTPGIPCHQGRAAGRKKKNAAVLIELAKSESTYCGSNYEISRIRSSTVRDGTCSAFMSTTTLSRT